MANNNGYIYIRRIKQYDEYGICKLGKITNIPITDILYNICEYEKGYYEFIIEIQNDQLYNETDVEELLQQQFEKYRTLKYGGNDFYKIEIIDEIIPFLNTTNINFKVLTTEEIDNLYKNI